MDAIRENRLPTATGLFRNVIAYGAGGNDPERQQPVGDSARTAPRQADAIAAAELDRALDDPHPPHGIAQILTRWTAAFALDPDGVTRTTALGAQRMARRLGEALPDGDRPLRTAVRTLVGPMPSPRLAALNTDALPDDRASHTTVDLAAHRRKSTLDDLDLHDNSQAAPPA